jgi:hypothetical protein
MVIGCTQEKKAPYEGGWKLVFASYPSLNLTFPVNMTGQGVKIWTSGAFTLAGQYKVDTVIYDNYGWGTYSITEGNKYTEHVLFHHLSESLVGQSIKMILEVKNDTLIQRWPVDDNWRLPEKYSIEKYIRLK